MLFHVISAAGIETDPEKTEAVRNWPVPERVEDLRTFLGFTGYYRRFIPNYAKQVRPLNDLKPKTCIGERMGSDRRVPESFQAVSRDSIVNIGFELPRLYQILRLEH